MEQSSLPESRSPRVGTAEFDERCLEYFKKKYKERLENWSNEPLHEVYIVPIKPVAYPVPEHLDDGILPYLLNDRLLFLSCKEVSLEQYLGQTSPILCCYLWETFCTSPGNFLHLQSSFIRQTDVRRPEFDEYRESLRRANQPERTGLQGILDVIFETRKKSRIESFSNFLEAASRLADDAGGCSWWEVVQIKTQLERLRLDLEKNGLESCWTWKPQSYAHTLYNLGFPRPFFNGLMQYVHSLSESLAEPLLQRGLDLLPDIPIQSPTTSKHILDNAASAKKPGYQHITVLFNASGTGKTRRILDTMSGRWGFYLMAPNLEPQDIAKGLTSPVAPKRGSASRDTYSAFEDLVEMDKAGNHRPPRGLKSQFANDTRPWYLHAQALYMGRKALLDAYKAMMGNKASKMQWTQLQTRCSRQNDPFDIMYRLYKFLLTKEPYKWMKPFSIKEDMFVDEAQTVLDDSIAKNLQRVLFELSGVSVLSGTSLRLPDAVLHAESALWAKSLLPGTKESAHWSTTESMKIQTEAALYVRTTHELLEVVQQHSWEMLRETYGLQRLRESANLEASEAANHCSPFASQGGRSLAYPIDFSDGLPWDQKRSELEKWDLFKSTAAGMIGKQGTMFYGRVRWATIFAEELLSISARSKGILQDEDILDATNKASTLIKEALKAQVVRVKDTAWVNDLYWTAIYADVYSVTKLFSKQDEASLNAIAQGFALVDKEHSNFDTVRACLSEPLAVEAVMEHLRSSPQYDKMLHQFAGSLAMDFPGGGALGKLSEFIFAAKLDNMLHLAGPSMQATSRNVIALQQRAYFLDIIQRAKDRVGQAWNIAFQDADLLNQYELDYTRNADRTQAQAILQSSRSMTDWLAKDDSERSTFLFPDEKDGPDLLFFLRRVGPSAALPDPTKPSRILCSIQFKTGNIKDSGEMFKILKTLVIKPWVKNQCSWPVISVLVANMVTVQKEFNNAFKELQQSGLVHLNQPQLMNEMHRIVIEMQNKSISLGQDFAPLNQTLHNLQNHCAPGPIQQTQQTAITNGLQGLNRRINNMKGFMDAKEKFAKEFQKMQPQQGMKDNVYVCCIDKSQSDDIWGKTFQDVMKTLKSRP